MFIVALDLYGKISSNDACIITQTTCNYANSILVLSFYFFNLRQYFFLKTTPQHGLLKLTSFGQFFRTRQIITHLN